MEDKLVKERRNQEIKDQIKEIRKQTGKLRTKRYSLEVELDHLNGHYDKSWEEVYGK